MNQSLCMPLREKGGTVSFTLKLVLASILLLVFQTPHLHGGQISQGFAVALSPTPVFNSPRFSEIFGGENGNRLKTDNCGQIRELEFIALTGTVFLIQNELSDNTSTILRVTTSDYPYDPPGGLFLDSRFVSRTDSPPAPRHTILPTKDEILSRLRSSQGIHYVWGGNVSGGIPELTSWYPPHNLSPLAGATKDRWQLAGLDCSGLLYEATGGWTPRNTSSLVTFGKLVDTEGLRADSIARKLKPLDLIVWPGHLLIALDKGEIIESRLNCAGRNSGVVIRPARERLQELLRTRMPVNKIGIKGRGKFFVVRRWHENDR